MTIHTPKTQPVIRAYQLQQQIERMQQHYHFAVKIESKKLLLIGCQVDRCTSGALAKLMLVCWTMNHRCLTIDIASLVMQPWRYSYREASIFSF
ncbi:MAG: hypothetical protein CLLPBCKN_000903 [Chroococcidiopsis cubana SAG 39.79]|uniref:hypothetical protein n=1 Tax=Chroococcidiopsis cubana TaxID=171392 RepID=UPI000F8D4242|nr:hypothetical protein [Chroococcidiopsis cubana]MDZ4871515.1 hypothetical protein [Chroococcidiopsis cubana SAG 39.79]